MKIVSEMELRNFQFWSGAKDTAAELTVEQLDQVEAIFEDLYPDGMTDTQINDIFWFERQTIHEWLGINEFPKWAVFKSKLGHQRIVEVGNETEEDDLNRAFSQYDIKAEWHESDDEPDFEDVSGYNLEATYCEDFDEWLWEEDYPDWQFTLWLPRDWAAAYENDDHSGMSEDEECDFAQFMSEYERELCDTEHYYYYWDTENITFKDEPDYGEAGECCTLRIYEKK